MVDYCKLIREQIQVQQNIKNYTINGDCEEEISCPVLSDVSLTIPEKLLCCISVKCSGALGVILTNTDTGVFVKSFSKGYSIARESHQINEGDRLCAVNGHSVNTTVEAKECIVHVNDAVSSYS